MPAYLTNRSSGRTLPSRLQSLGNSEFDGFGAITARSVGNAVIGYSISPWEKIKMCLSESDAPTNGPRKMILLPLLFSPTLAHVFLFFRTVFYFLLILLIGYATNLYSVNIGWNWVLGCMFTLYVLLNLSQIRFQRDGVMSFCRSMGQPATEEMMFSYSWKVEVCPDCANIPWSRIDNDCFSSVSCATYFYMCRKKIFEHWPRLFGMPASECGLYENNTNQTTIFDS
jgi:hypothetical protein